MGEKVEDVLKSQRGSTLATGIMECDEDHFPNIFALLKIARPLPVTSCECERSFSAMRRHRTWLHSTVKTESLTALTIVKIHRGRSGSWKGCATIFAAAPKKATRIKFNIMFCILLVFLLLSLAYVFRSTLFFIRMLIFFVI